MKNTLKTAILISMVFTISCSKTDATEEKNFSPQLENLAENVILKTYDDLKNKSILLQTTITKFSNEKTKTNLDAAKTAWIAARSPWEQSEGFLFGPVETEGIDPKIDKWPLDANDLNGILLGANSLTAEYVELLNENLKGFHAIEFLLWGQNSNKNVQEFSQRDLDYLKATATVLAKDCKTLYDLWATGNDNYFNTLINAGKGSQAFLSQKSAMLEIVDFMANIINEVGNEKITTPFSSKDITKEESSFSNNSKADFINNIKSVKNLYWGVYENHGNGNGIHLLVHPTNAVLDAKIKNQIDEAIKAIEDIQGTFSEAVKTQSQTIVNAQNKISDLKATIEGELKIFIETL